MKLKWVVLGRSDIVSHVLISLTVLSANVLKKVLRRSALSPRLTKVTKKYYYGYKNTAFFNILYIS